MGGPKPFAPRIIIIMSKGKNYRAAREKVEAKPMVETIKEGIGLLKEVANTKFDGTVELHMNLNIDPRKADQTIRNTIVLPHGTGKKLKIAAVVNDDQAKAAKDAGATAAGLEDLIAEFEKGKFDYDVIVATPDAMKKLGKVAKTLGQKGLMPNPKSGTVSQDITKTIQEISRGRVEFRNDKEGNLHTILGKVSFSEDALESNLKAMLKAIKENKPSGAKGSFIKSITICSSMSPGIRLDAKVLEEA